jgi:hypothetical protein
MRYIDHGNNIIEIESDDACVTNATGILELLFDAQASALIVRKECVNPDFFKLSTGIAGEILQKFSNYKRKLGVVGDFSHIQSKPLRDFIFESNKTKQVVFVGSVKEAVELLQ